MMNIGISIRVCMGMVICSVYMPMGISIITCICVV